MVTIFTNSLKANNFEFCPRSVSMSFIILTIDKNYFPVQYSSLIFLWTHIIFSLIYELELLM
jgi:hypothetical protein